MRLLAWPTDAFSRPIGDLRATADVDAKPDSARLTPIEYELIMATTATQAA
jgi:hypothetical protein